VSFACDQSSELFQAGFRFRLKSFSFRALVEGGERSEQKKRRALG